MRAWRAVPGDKRLLFSPVGLLLVDDLTGRPPIAAVEAILELQDGTDWRPVHRDSLVTASGVLTYPGLGRGDDVAQPAQHYRVRLESPVYRPLYRATVDGIEFDAPPFDDGHPPVPVTQRTTPAVLLPGASYGFAPFIPVLHGLVVDPGGNPVPDVLVHEGLRERTLSDERGAFSLALRWVVPGVPTPIVADDQRNARSGFINVTLPAALNQSQRITVS